MINTTYNYSALQKLSRTVLGAIALLGLLAAAAPNQVAASCTATTCTDTIEMLYVNKDTSSVPVYVKLRGGKPANCNLQSNVYWKLQQNADNQYKLLLAAYLSGKKVKLRMVNAQTICTISYVTTAE